MSSLEAIENETTECIGGGPKLWQMLTSIVSSVHVNQGIPRLLYSILSHDNDAYTGLSKIMKKQLKNLVIENNIDNAKNAKQSDGKWQQRVQKAKEIANQIGDAAMNQRKQS